MKRVIIALFLAIFLFIGGIFLGAWTQSVGVPATPTPVVYPTGAQVLEELQLYRLSQGKDQFELSSILCDNLYERWVNYKKNGDHTGFEEFVKKEYPPGFTASEIMVAGDSAKQMVQKWSQSPGHNQAILTHSKICVYSDEGLAVGMLSN